jgi:hypothetical protein
VTDQWGRVHNHDNLFVVVRPATGKPTLVRLRY